MSDAIKQHLNGWRLTYVYCAIFLIGSVCSIVMASLQGVTWVTLDTQTRVLIVVAGIWNFCNTAGALVVKIGKATGNPIPINGGDTEQLKKT